MEYMITEDLKVHIFVKTILLIFLHKKMCFLNVWDCSSRMNFW